MAVPAEQVQRYTWADLQAFDDGVMRELIDGRFVVSPAPLIRHERVGIRIIVELFGYARNHGGEVFGPKTALFFDDNNAVEPDAFFVSAARAGQIQHNRIVAPVDLVVEVSSPSTRRLDLGGKRELYEASGIEQHWFVDLPGEQVLMFTLAGGKYGEPEVKKAGDMIEPAHLPGLRVEVSVILLP